MKLADTKEILDQQTLASLDLLLQTALQIKADRDAAVEALEAIMDDQQFDSDTQRLMRAHAIARAALMKVRGITDEVPA